jgi:hypothetical protein
VSNTQRAVRIGPSLPARNLHCKIRAARISNLARSARLSVADRSEIARERHSMDACTRARTHAHVNASRIFPLPRIKPRGAALSTDDPRRRRGSITIREK